MPAKAGVHFLLELRWMPAGACPGLRSGAGMTLTGSSTLQLPQHIKPQRARQIAFTFLIDARDQLIERKFFRPREAFQLVPEFGFQRQAGIVLCYADGAFHHFPQCAPARKGKAIIVSRIACSDGQERASHMEFVITKTPYIEMILKIKTPINHRRAKQKRAR